MFMHLTLSHCSGNWVTSTIRDFMGIKYFQSRQVLVFKSISATAVPSLWRPHTHKHVNQPLSLRLLQFMLFLLYHHHHLKLIVLIAMEVPSRRLRSTRRHLSRTHPRLDLWSSHCPQAFTLTLWWGSSRQRVNNYRYELTLIDICDVVTQLTCTDHSSSRRRSREANADTVLVRYNWSIMHHSIGWYVTDTTSVCNDLVCCMHRIDSARHFYMMLNTWQVTFDYVIRLSCTDNHLPCLTPIKHVIYSMVINWP